jgi:hypothetical protein
MAATSINSAIFQHLQEKIDEEGKIREVKVALSPYFHIAEQCQGLKDIIQQLEKQGLPAMETSARHLPI